MWYNRKLFGTLISTFFIFLCIYLVLQLLPYFTNLLWLVSNVLLSFILALILYYVTRPLRDYLESKNISRYVAILLIFLLLLGCLSLISMYIGPSLIKQINSFTETPKEKIMDVEKTAMNFLSLFDFTSTNRQQLIETAHYYIREAMLYLINNISYGISSLAKIASYVVITPFVLFYLLKEDYRMFSDLPEANRWVNRKDMRRIFTNIDHTLAQYVSGQVLVAAIVGILIFIGYSIIGLNYALSLALIAFIFNLIPFCGPFISTIPALLIGFSQSPLMGVLVLAVVLTVHLLDLNFISPRIVGYTLNIHPIIIILLLVLGFNLAGLLGLFFITPAYAVCRSVIKEIYKIQENSKKAKEIEA